MDISKLNMNVPWQFDGRYISDSKNNIICQIVGDTATQIIIGNMIQALPDLITITADNIMDAMDAEEDRNPETGLRLMWAIKTIISLESLDAGNLTLSELEHWITNAYVRKNQKGLSKISGILRRYGLSTEEIMAFFVHVLGCDEEQFIEEMMKQMAQDEEKEGEDRS